MPRATAAHRPTRCSPAACNWRARPGTRRDWARATRGSRHPSGPHGATLADGSEYTGRYGLSVAALREWHRPRLEVLAAASPDLIAVETIPSLVELEAICGLLDGLGVPAWVSGHGADGALRTGESLEDALAMAASVDDVSRWV